MRLFLGLHPPEPVLDELADAVAPLRRRLPELRWIPRQNYHITLVFLGEVAEPRRLRLQQLLQRKLARHDAVPLRIAGAGTFPRDTRTARVLWAGVHGELARLQQASAKAARDARVPVEDRRYIPHLTLARCRTPTDIGAQLTELHEFAGRTWRAAQVRLIRSELGGTPRYTTVASWDLGGR